MMACGRLSLPQMWQAEPTTNCVLTGRWFFAIMLRHYNSIMIRLIYHILAGIIGFWLTTGLPDVHFDGPIQSLVLAGFVLGVINYAVKPILDIVTFPLKILTFGLFSVFLNMAIVWGVDVLILGKIFTLWPLFLATIILSILNLILIKK